MISLGIDSGSTMIKGVLYDGNKILSSCMLPTSFNPAKAIRMLYEQMYTKDVQVVVTTGYGRKLLPEANLQITEITCHGVGAFFLNPECNTVLDIGGQDCKVMTLNCEGQVTDFLMNDKCAAGTGRFLEITMERVESKIDQIDSFVEGCNPVTINSMCTVFAESEIVGYLAQGKKPGDIVLGCVDSICKRTAAFAQKLAVKNPRIFFSGGLAQSRVMCAALEKYLNVQKMETHSLCQYAGAIGAAVLGYRKICN